VHTNTFGAAWIEQIASDGITAGCGGGNFCPQAAVTREQMAVFLMRAKHAPGYVPPLPTGLFADLSLNDPFTKWIEELAHEGVTAGCGNGDFCPRAVNTRGQMAAFVVRTFGLQ
jgi:S-layer homology domain